jgi:hypothetical protein
VRVLVADATGGLIEVHQVHLLLLLGGWALTIVTWQFRRQLFGRSATHSPGEVLVAVTATLFSAGTHLLVTPEHVALGAAYGAFFVTVTAAQLLWSVVYLWRPDDRTLVVGAVGSALVAALWLETRFVGLGVGPLPAGRESFGVPDVLCTLTEVVLVVLAVRLVRRRRGSRAAVSAARSGRSTPAAAAAAGTPAR